MGGFDNIGTMGFMNDMSHNIDSWNMMGFMGHMGAPTGF